MLADYCGDISFVENHVFNTWFSFISGCIGRMLSYYSVSSRRNLPLKVQCVPKSWILCVCDYVASHCGKSYTLFFGFPSLRNESRQYRWCFGENCTEGTLYEFYHHSVRTIRIWNFFFGMAVYVKPVNRLRQKIEPDAGEPKHIRSVRGVGYQFMPSIV